MTNKTSLLKFGLPLIFLAFAVVVAVVIIKSKPTAKKRIPTASAQIVEIATLKAKHYQIDIPVMGTVIPEKEVTIAAQVSGQVMSVSSSFVPGGYFSMDDEIMQIDPTDYQLAVQQQQATLADAEYSLKVEMGYQKVSAREWELLKKSAKGTAGDADLALRKPHLVKAQAELKSAYATLRQAQVNLARTTIKAPFSSMVTDRNVNTGATVSTNSGLATLIGTDTFWVEASIPVDRLNWLGNSSQTPIAEVNSEAGLTVRVESQASKGNTPHIGHIVRLLPSLEDEGRMARVIISIEDPLNLTNTPNTQPLLLGSYVKAYIEADQLENVFTIPRSAFHDNDTIWILSEAGTLEVRSVTPLWRDADNIIVRENIQNGERLVISNIAVPLTGMALRATQDDTKEVQKKRATPSTTRAPRGVENE